MWRFLKKLKIELPYNPAIALLGIYPKDTGVLIHRGTCTPMFIAALSTIAKSWKEPKCPSTDEWINAMPFAATWIELDGIMLSEISQRKTDICFHSYVELEKLNGRPGGKGSGKNSFIQRGRQTIRDSRIQRTN